MDKRIRKTPWTGLGRFGRQRHLDITKLHIAHARKKYERRRSVEKAHSKMR